MALSSSRLVDAAETREDVCPRVFRCVLGGRRTSETREDLCPRVVRCVLGGRRSSETREDLCPRVVSSVHRFRGRR